MATRIQGASSRWLPEFAIMLPLVVGLMLAAVFGSLLPACGDLLSAMFMTFIYVLFPLIVVPQLLLGTLAAAALAAFVVKPLKTPRRLRGLFIGIVALLLLATAAGAGATLAHLVPRSTCTLGVWN